MDFRSLHCEQTVDNSGFAFKHFRQIQVNESSWELVEVTELSTNEKEESAVVEVVVVNEFGDGFICGDE